MKKIEYFLNRLYYTIYCMTDWLSFKPIKKQDKYEKSLELSWIFGGINNIYAFLVISALISAIEYFCNFTILRYLVNNSICFILVLLLIICIDDLCIWYYVYKDKKYITYCMEFEKETKITKMMWTLYTILFFIFAIVLFFIILQFRHLCIHNTI